ncbi:MAG: hypothetical protein JWM62_3124 [Frankiales bacterium]|jgi:hypothetical protein|nr:hypothetical protein [Frankiales bacterium]
MRFSRKRSGSIEAKVDAVEADVLLAVAGDLLVLLGEQDEPDEDPLAAMVGLSSGPMKRPDDPALARLLPDAYGDDDAAATEFRRYTELDLRAGKRAHATAVLTGLSPLAGRGGRLVLDRDDADAWLGCLNDLRLVLGTRLEVTEETELEPRSDDPRAHALQVYGWLGWLQESLLSCLEPRGQ